MRYIDADKIEKPIYAEDDNVTGCGMTYDEMDAYNDAINKTIEAINRTPTADVAEVIHGRWIETSAKSHVGKKCSNCSARIKYSEYFNGNHLYCHKCGARMDLTKKEN